jgi:cytochrome c556
LTGLLALATLPAFANPGGADRQHAFKKILLQFEPMGVIVRGRNPYNKASFIQYADALKLVAPQPFTLFPANSIDSGSRAKPTIWSQPAQFKEKKDNFLKAVDDMDAAAHAGGLANVSKAYNTLAQSCKACHDSFRGPKV